MVNHFNVRVYGLLFNKNDELLVTDEYCFGQNMTKFPGGGLEFGEGLIDGLRREFREELGIELNEIKHFYTSDFFQVSAFNPSGQLICVYYKVLSIDEDNISVVNQPFDGLGEIENTQIFRWLKLEKLYPSQLTWPIDKHVVNLLKQ